MISSTTQVQWALSCLQRTVDGREHASLPLPQTQNNSQERDKIEQFRSIRAGKQSETHWIGATKMMNPSVDSIYHKISWLNIRSTFPQQRDNMNLIIFTSYHKWSISTLKE